MQHIAEGELTDGYVTLAQQMQKLKDEAPQSIPCDCCANIVLIVP